MKTGQGRLLLLGGEGAGGMALPDGMAGYETETLRTGGTALSRLAVGGWDGLIIALAADARAAIGVAAQAKALRPGTVVVLVGVLHAPEVMEEAFRAGVDAVVDPREPGALEAAVVSRLGLLRPAAAERRPA